MDDPILILSKINVNQIEKGDILIIKTDDPIPEEAVMAVKAKLLEMGAKDFALLILSKDTEISLYKNPKE